MRFSLPFLLIFAAVAHGQEIQLPREVRAAPGAWIIVAPVKHDGGVIRWRADPALQEVPLDLLLPPDVLKTLRGKVYTGPSGRHRVEAWTAKGDVPSDISVCWIIIGEVPPEPSPDPPNPNPKPLPVRDRKLFICVVEETADATAQRGAWFSDAALAERIRAKGHTFRVVDKDTKVVKPISDDKDEGRKLSAYIKRAIANKLPYVMIVEQEGVGPRQIIHEGPLPENPAAAIRLLEKLGG